MRHLWQIVKKFLIEGAGALHLRVRPADRGGGWRSLPGRRCRTECHLTVKYRRLPVKCLVLTGHENTVQYVYCRKSGFWLLAPELFSGTGRNSETESDRQEPERSGAQERGINVEHFSWEVRIDGALKICNAEILLTHSNPG